MALYPQGWHLLTALLESFVAPGGVSGFAALDLLLVFHVATYGLFGLVLSVGVVLGRRPARAHRRTVGARGRSLRGHADHVRSDPSGHIGLPRPNAGSHGVDPPDCAARAAHQSGTQPAHRGDRVVVALGFGYYVYLPLALAAVSIWAWRPGAARGAARPRTFAPARWCLVSLLPFVLGMTDHQAEGLTFTGTPPLVGRNVVVAALLVILAGTVTTRSGRRSPIWRSYGLAAAPTLVGDAGSGSISAVGLRLHRLLLRQAVGRGRGRAAGRPRQRRAPAAAAATPPAAACDADRHGRLRRSSRRPLSSRCLAA